ncbi:MAG: S1 RNA-binding domain-containing protein [Phycisphaerae bacterium]|jgi:small subunit ribosomal protein S1
MDPHEFDDGDLKRQLDDALGGLDQEELERLAHEGPSEPHADERGRIRGRIASIRGSDVFVDIGGKSEGLLSLDEFEPDQPPTVGQVLDLVPHGFDQQLGLMRLSLREVKLQVDVESVRVGDVVKGRVTGSNIGGLELRVQGARGFMPMSQVDLVRHEDFGAFIGRWLEAEVTEVDRRGRRLVLSRRRVLEREREEERQQLRYQLAEGQVRPGKVVRIVDFGAFVDLGGIEGLLHISDMSWGRLRHPSEAVKIGEEIQVQVLKIDLVKDRISLGMKQMSADPWTLVPTNYSTGQTIDARVLKLANFGAFVELEPGVEGLIPISEMSWTQHIRHPKDILKEGDSVRVSILALDPENRKLTLSLKALEQDPWTSVTERYTPDSVVSGAVMRTTKFGAFVQLEEGVEGLVHISQLSHQHVRNVEDVVKPGQVVQVRVLSVDAEQRRISLSMKAAVEAPPSEASAESGHAPPPPEKRRKKPLRGGLSW